MAAADYASRVRTLLRDHNHHIVNWVTLRVLEQYDLDVHALKALAERYIHWSASMLDATMLNLQKRRWTSTLGVVSGMAADSLNLAARQPTDGARGMPLLLKSACYHNAFVNHLGGDTARFVAADLGQPLQAGLRLLGDARGAAVIRAAAHAAQGAAAMVNADIRTAGAHSRALPPEPLPPLGPGLPGGTTEPEARKLAGHWIDTEFHDSVGSHGRVELHMVLHADGQVVRTAKSSLLATLRDASGQWIGALESVAGLDTGESGRWSATGFLLTLDMRDGSAYEYRYTLRGAELITTNTNGGAQRYWRRHAR